MVDLCLRGVATIFLERSAKSARIRTTATLSRSIRMQPASQPASQPVRQSGSQAVRQSTVNSRAATQLLHNRHLQRLGFIPLRHELEKIADLPSLACCCNVDQIFAEFSPSDPSLDDFILWEFAQAHLDAEPTGRPLLTIYVAN